MKSDAGGIEGGPVLEPVTQFFVDSLAAEPAFETESVGAARAFLGRLQSVPVGRPGASTETITLPVGPTGAVDVKVVRPRDGRAGRPIIMHFRGGWWALGDCGTHDRLTRELAVGADATLISVDYDRFPEAAYPVAIEQAYAATRFVADNAAGLKVDGTRLAVIGDGFGAHLAAAVTHLAKQRRGPKIDLQVLLCPITDTTFDTESWRTFAHGPWLTASMMRRLWDAYLPDVGRRRENTAAPLAALLEDLRDLPDTLICVAENDILRDEGEAYARRLSDAGVRVTCARYAGTIHDFTTLNALADTPAARAAIAQTIWALCQAFG